MPKQIIIAEQHRIAAVFSEEQIQELIVATGSHQVSDIYLGVVENVLPGIDAAFVNIGDSERNGFIHVSDLGPLRLRRTAGSITELLVPQQKVLVQVMKEPTGNKGPRLTGNISLPGRYLVMMPYNKGVNLSRRIRNENERNRLRALAILIKPAGMGLVVRTEAEGMPEEAIIEDLENLQRQWEAILQEATSTRAPALLNRDDDFIQRVLRDVYSSDVNRIVVDSHTGLKRVKQQLMNWGGGRMPQGVFIDHHRDRVPILEYFRINAAIREALKPRVDLPSGGYIIIERTEALTVIDVNSGSFTRSATARETVLWTNCEAATEIARQLRLRNIAGVIVVDFIDMESHRDKLQVLEHFNKALRADKARPQIAQLSELGLVELTRKRQGKNIYELFGRTCPQCGGLGHLGHLPGEPEESMGELVERTVVPSLPEYRPAERSTEGRSRGRESSRDAGLPEIPVSGGLVWEDRSHDDESSDLQELTHHPSYQEMGANRRRRRRRVGEDLPPVRERGRGTWEDSRGGSPLPPPELATSPDLASEGDEFAATDDLPVVRGRRSEPPTRGGRGRGRSGKTITHGVGKDFVPGREVEPLQDGGSLTPEPSSFPAVEEKRGRSKRDGGKIPTTPPEVVAVEMTPEEQEVFAWMGVSPLVLSNQEVKNPKSAVVSVVLPGQVPTSPAIVSVRAAEDEPLGTAPPSISPTSSLPSDAESSSDDSVTEAASEPESTDSSAVNRRRRRRSSATVND
ncbi:Rne/Rng family ribonuclease [Pantanalinema sp. GBBB05]|uniref:Rne/Rng family ribonuclease n=1 Tax=Pantanalinema sp. GBBB05 TaxID=2604139 RepID=UPI001D720117|nr:ribonuclease E/G [Pantanalinema sp. GBBB05]